MSSPYSRGKKWGYHSLKRVAHATSTAHVVITLFKTYFPHRKGNVTLLLSMKQVPLREFIHFLNTRSEEDFKGEYVDQYLGENTIDHEEMLPYIFFREDCYGRTLIAKSELYELLALTWLPNQRTPIHDHAGQRCWMTVQLGSLTMKNYAPPIAFDGLCDLDPVGQAEICDVGASVYIDDGIGVHSIANAGKRPAISMHLYARPVPRCRIYNERSKMFEWKKLEYFKTIDEGWTLETPELHLPSDI